ncbi:c-type cytochrome [Desertibaculum subflavum]|uniref:c-type cytochrome n=1 Tax=Desertibaculum subflavum TaxID=2268458 RepID=UPI000E666DB4
MCRAATAAILTLAGLLIAAGAVHAADPERGRELYEARCTGCHSIDANRVGPMHRGVFGRKAGSVADFTYSPAVKASAIVWNDATLDRWLAGPQKLIPGQRMNFTVGQPEDRADIIAYLKSDAAR